MSRRALMAVVAGAATYKSIEHLFVFGTGVWWFIGGPLLIGALATGLRPRIGMAVIAAAALITNLTPAYRNHLHFLMLTALALALFSDEDTERWVLRWQLSIMYGFAATAKLNAEWLDGSALEARTWIGDALPTEAVVVLAVGTIAVEAALAIGLWSRWRGWFWIAAVLHVSFVLLTQTDAWDLARLTTFATIVLAVWFRAFRGDLPHLPGREVGDRPGFRRSRASG